VKRAFGRRRDAGSGGGAPAALVVVLRFLEFVEGDVSATATEGVITAAGIDGDPAV